MDNEVCLLTAGEHQSITDNINTELNKYLEEVAEKHKVEDNYFDGCDKATNTLPEVQEVFHHQDPDDTTLEDNTSRETPESLEDEWSDNLFDHSIHVATFVLFSHFILVPSHTTRV